MQIDMDNVKVVVSNKDTLDVLQIIYRKALGKVVDEIVVAKLVTMLEGHTRVDPSIVKKKEKLGKKEPANDENKTDKKKD